MTQKSKEEFFNTMKSDASNDDIKKIDKNLNSMKKGKLAEVWDDVMRIYNFMKDPNTPWVGKAIAIAALLYMISPIDAIPDFIPIAGLVDDVGIIAMALAKLTAEYKEYIK